MALIQATARSRKGHNVRLYNDLSGGVRTESEGRWTIRPAPVVEEAATYLERRRERRRQ
jgi:hypothetical protein